MRCIHVESLRFASALLAFFAFTIAVHAEYEHHEHPSEGPHNGSLVELGDEEYHAEVVHDDEECSVTVYILDSSAKMAVPIEAPEVVINVKYKGTPQQFKLPARPDKQDPKGKASRFTVKNESLCHAMDEEDAQPVLRLKIAGKSFSGQIAHDHEHDHEGKDSKKK